MFCDRVMILFQSKNTFLCGGILKQSERVVVSNEKDYTILSLFLWVEGGEEV